MTDFSQNPFPTQNFQTNPPHRSTDQNQKPHPSPPAHAPTWKPFELTSETLKSTSSFRSHLVFSWPDRRKVCQWDVLLHASRFIYLVIYNAHTYILRRYTRVGHHVDVQVARSPYAHWAAFSPIVVHYIWRLVRGHRAAVLKRWEKVIWVKCDPVFRDWVAVTAS